MDTLNLYLRDKRNTSMIQDICIQKIKSHVDHLTFGKIKQTFKKMFNNVMFTVFEQEINNYDGTSIKKNVLRINNIVIKEAFNYITNVYKDDIMCTSLDDIEEEESRTEYIEELKRENNEKEEIQESKHPSPEFNEEIYEIGSKNMTKEGNVYISEIYIPNVISLEMIHVRIDKSDYMITEFCNKFSINNSIVEVNPGNYNENELKEEIQRLFDIHINSKKDYIMKVLVCFERKRDCYTFSYKNIDGNNKENIPEISIDFSIPWSLSPIIGFEKTKYIIKPGDCITGNKHNLNYPIFTLFNVNFTEEIKAQVLVPLNVDYNQTKFYNVEYKKLYKSKDPLFAVSNIKITIENERDEPYNTRNRDFSLRFKTISLVDS